MSSVKRPLLVDDFDSGLYYSMYMTCDIHFRFAKSYNYHILSLYHIIIRILQYICIYIEYMYMYVYHTGILK